MRSHGTITTLRRILFWTLAIGIVGTESELLLLGHFDDWKQYTPLILLALALVVQGWYFASRSAASIRVLRVAMWLFVVSGAVGVALHLIGNIEFELEMSPGLTGWELFRESVTGATPVLAPGAMLQLGLIGLAWAFRHPVLSRTPNDC